VEAAKFNRIVHSRQQAESGPESKKSNLKKVVNVYQYFFNRLKCIASLSLAVLINFRLIITIYWLAFRLREKTNDIFSFLGLSPDKPTHYYYKYVLYVPACEGIGRGS